MSKSPRGTFVKPVIDTDLTGNPLTGEGGGPRHLSITQLTPDGEQPRWVLPSPWRDSYLAGKLTAVDAYLAWRKAAQKTRDAVELERLSEIAQLADSLQVGGQVNPITVVRTENGYRIETGERRFWAHVHLVAVAKDPAAADVPVTVQGAFDPFRQAIENLHTRGLNAIAMTRQIVRLLIAEGAIPAPGQELTPLEAYRSAAEQRVGPGGWKRVEIAMGLKADSLARFLRLLRLPGAALATADRANLSEKQLRPVVDVADPKAQVKIVALAAELNLSASDVAWLCAQKDLKLAEKVLRARLAGKPAPDAKAKSRPDDSVVLQKRFQALTGYARRLQAGDQDPVALLAQALSSEYGEDATTQLGELVELLERVRKALPKPAKKAGQAGS
jgi:ParB-like chromosome segregation protein Spo0J